MHPQHENKHLEKTNSEIQIINKTLPTLITAHNLEDVYEKSNGETSMKPLETDIQKTDDQQKCVEGKTMQKQKNKNKVKSRELNRRGAEKEGTDMDAFVHPIQVSASSVKIEMKHDSLLQKDINKDENSESTKNIEDSDNYELLKEKNLSEIDPQSVQKNITSLDEDEKSASAIQKEISLKNKNNKESILEDVLVNAHIAKDCDHISIFRTNVDKEIVPSIVAQKNEENSKISGLGSVLKDSDICSNTLKSVSTSVITKTIPLLKYTYSDDQWSPINTNGKKIYGREFLMKLQNDPNSKAKPSNLPDLDVVLDSTKIRSPVDLWFKDSNLGRHDSLFPGFVKSSVNTKVSTSIKQKHISKPKTNKPNMIHLSFSREDVKLRETENAWKPRRLVQGSVSEEQTKTEALYKRVRSVLNKLTPQKFSTLVNQVRELEIDTQEKLQGVIDLVFEKAVDEPNFSVAYALMCKELSNMQVAGADSEDCTVANFRKLILTRCQSEFEKNTLDENARNEKLKEVDECADLERKKELQMNFDEEERRIRVKSLGNIRFIGELFKQNMLTSKIMYQCIRHLLKQVDEENLECLCKLLTTIGKVLESKTADLSEYFKQMQQIANRKGKISSRIRFMLQDVIDLRGNKWIPRRDDSNPKTMDQIQREAESERLDIQLSNASLNTPRKDERVNERKRNRGAVGSMEEGGWSQPVGRTRQVYSVEAAKLKNKPPSMDDMQLGSRSTYQWLKPKMTTPNKFAYLEKVTAEPDKRVPSIHLSGSKSTGSRDYVRPEYKSNYDGRSSRNGTYQINTSSYNRDNTMVESTRSQSLSLISSSKFPSQTSSATNIPELSEEQLKKAINSFIEEYVAEEEQNVDEGVKVFSTIFSITSHISFIHETINTVFEKSDYHQKKTSQLFAQLLYHNCISLLDFRTGLGAVLEVAGDLIIDIPRLWKYFANILVYPVINDSYCLTDLYTTIHHLLPKLRCKDHAAELFAELLLELVTLKEIEWVNQKWSQSGIHWHDLLDNRTKVDKFIIDHKLDFLLPNKTIDVRSFEVQHESISGLNIEKIHDKLLPLLKNSNFDEICGWIQTNVGDKIKEPKFIRILMTAILETSVEQCNDKWTFKRENFDKLQKLIQRYVDAEDDLELQCLFAVQEYITKLSHPAGLIVKIMTCLYENNVLSNEAFLTWEKNEDPAERKGKSVSLVSLKSFFIPLKEVEDISSGEEV
ncbi:PREDICTED: eukaryotic translation initiation factor 4 gamma 3-like [Ceratosolen solmsi marchali]|uniref:Eukaryotic translation initiation factor 4 gamma 3-like n=1 Tax=Ceratosolen solmsi marchali TaxID=326594 RepID=A0AAJ6YQM4_9HYME|nr:PREDICTED: eukaryotic translation initiation factor 4 gamma 3-like [Ceratosolen solmsi marchali]